MPVPDDLKNSIRQILADEASALAEADICWDWEETADRLIDAIAEHPSIFLDDFFRLIREQGNDLIGNGESISELYPQAKLEGRARILAGNALQELSVVISAERTIEDLDRNIAKKAADIISELKPDHDG